MKPYKHPTDSFFLKPCVPQARNRDWHSPHNSWVQILENILIWKRSETTGKPPNTCKIRPIEKWQLRVWFYRLPSKLQGHGTYDDQRVRIDQRTRRYVVIECIENCLNRLYWWYLVFCSFEKCRFSEMIMYVYFVWILCFKLKGLCFWTLEVLLLSLKSLFMEATILKLCERKLLHFLYIHLTLSRYPIIMDASISLLNIHITYM